MVVCCSNATCCNRRQGHQIQAQLHSQQRTCWVGVGLWHVCCDPPMTSLPYHSVLLPGLQYIRAQGPSKVLSSWGMPTPGSGGGSGLSQGPVSAAAPPWLQYKQGGGGMLVLMGWISTDLA